MKALFVAAALVLAAVSSSYAAPAPVEVIRVQPHKVHKYLLGLWCSDDGLHYIVYFDDHLVEEQCRHDNVITIKADHYIGHEYGCTFTRIDAWVHPVAMATKTIGSPAFRAIANCNQDYDNEICRWREEFTIQYYTKGETLIHRRQLGAMDCQGRQS